MKILVISNKVPYPAKDGSSIAMASSIDGLLKNKAEVHLLSLNTLKHFKGDAEINKELPSSLHFNKENVNTNITPFNTLSNLLSKQAFHVSRFFQPSVVQRLITILKNTTFDVIQLEGLSLAVYINCIRENSQAKIVLRAHNVEYQIWERHLANEKNPIKKWYLKLQVNRLKKFEISTLTRIDGLVCITDKDSSIFSKLKPDLAKTSIPCGVNMAHYPSPQLSTNPSFDISYLASFDWLPNVQGMDWFMTKVWPEILRLRPQTTLTLGGRSMPAHFKKWETAHFVLESNVPNAAAFIAKGRVVVIPLLAGSGMRIKIIENMAMGKAMVSTPVGAEGIFTNNENNLLLAQEPTTFAQKVLHLLDNSSERKRLELNAYQTAKTHYENQMLGNQFLDFYKKLLC